MKNNNSIKIWLVAAFLATGACTDLEVEEKDSIVVESESGEFTGIDPVAGLNTGYTDLRGFGDQANLYALSEVTSDEFLVPTRGTDWGDNGVWRTLHQHTWDAAHGQILNTWNNLNSNVFRLNQLLDPRSGANAQQLAEGKFLRAYNMFLILDLWGQIPFRGVDDGPEVNPEVLNAQEAFDFIMNDLNEAIEDLPTRGPGVANTKTATKAAGHYLMAKLLLNKHVYLGGSAAAADMDAVVDHVNAIEADGFALHDGYFDIFKNTDDSETILWTDTGVGNRIWNGLHYNQPTPDNTGGGWNGFSTTADFYALFEGNDSNTPGNEQEERRGFVPNTPNTLFGIGYGFLVGQQYNAAGQPINDRAGNPLIYTPDFPGLAGNNERTGIRVIKYHPANPGGSFVSHYILFRFADAHLMKVEAILRGGNGEGETALALYNELRTLRDADPVASVALDDILDERGRELYGEGWRRNDQIRFGTYTQPFALKDNTEAFRVKFPIPANAISSNPNLVQNEGY